MNYSMSKRDMARTSETFVFPGMAGCLRNALQSYRNLGESPPVGISDYKPARPLDNVGVYQF